MIKLSRFLAVTGWMFFVLELNAEPLELRKDINCDLVPKLHKAYERYLPQVQPNDGYKSGFAKKYKISKSILEGFLTWVLPAREGITILTQEDAVDSDLDQDVVIIGPPIEETKNDTRLDLQAKLRDNSGFRRWMDTTLEGRTKTLLIPFADAKRGHWVLLTLKSDGEETYLQFVDSKFRFVFISSIANRAKDAFLKAVEAEVDKPELKASIYLGSQGILDRVSCGFQVVGMILQITGHSETANHQANKPIVISAMASNLKENYSFSEAMKKPYGTLIKEFTPKVDLDEDLDQAEF